MEIETLVVHIHSSIAKTAEDIPDHSVVDLQLVDWTLAFNLGRTRRRTDRLVLLLPLIPAFEVFIVSDEEIDIVEAERHH